MTESRQGATAAQAATIIASLALWPNLSVAHGRKLTSVLDLMDLKSRRAPVCSFGDIRLEFSDPGLSDLAFEMNQTPFVDG